LIEMPEIHFWPGRSVLRTQPAELLTTIRSGTACQFDLTRVFKVWSHIGPTVVPEREFPFSGAE
jgi:hypothetical protein